MKKRAIAIIFCTVALTFLLTGCIRTEVGVTLKPDGSGTIGTEVLIKSDAYETIKKSADPFDGKKTYTEKIDGSDYIGTKSTKEYRSAEEMKNALLALTFIGNVPTIKSRVSNSELKPGNTEIAVSDGSEKADVTKGAPIFRSVDLQRSSGTLTFKAALNPQTDMSSETIANTSMNNIYKLKIIITMPGKIKAASIGTISDNTVTWEINDITAENKMTVVSEAGNGHLFPVVILTVITLVIVTAIIAFLLIMKRRK